MNITTKNIQAKKKALVRLACQIVYERDHRCQLCGRCDGKMDAAHVIPRSRGWRWAVDLRNIVKLCYRCHTRWHEDPIWATMALAETRHDTTEYVAHAHHKTGTVTVTEATAKMRELNAAAEHHGIKGI